jgi:tRNA threonylcarbamoyladenosine biosynthesis protein TsaB
MLLFLDATDFQNIHLALVSDAGVRETTTELSHRESFKTLALVEQFLKKEKVALSEITKLVVCAGPGSFTGIRVGVALGEGLHAALGVPLTVITKNKVPTDLTKLLKLAPRKQFTPDYGGEPQITARKTA